MDVEEVRLRAVGLPELGGGRRAQGFDTAAWFECRNSPRSKGGDFAEMCDRGFRSWEGVMGEV